MKSMRFIPRLLFAPLITLSPLLHAQVPHLVTYQGRVTSGGVAFNGTGQFKFALVNAAGTRNRRRNILPVGGVTEGAGMPMSVAL
jgi:hypothetical protein